MSAIDAAWAADLSEARRRLTRAFAWYPKLDEVRRTALAAMYAELGPLDRDDFRRVTNHLARDQFQMASASVLLSAWAGRAGQRAWRVAQSLRAGQADVPPQKEPDE